MIYRHEFKGKPYASSVIGVANPRWAYESFLLEEQMRNEWWDVQPGDVVIDAGAGYGSYTLTALVAGAAFVVAVEPDKEVFFALCANLAQNRVHSRRCLVLPHVLCDVSGVVMGYDNMRNSAHSLDRTPLDPRMGDSVDAIMAEYQISRLDWLKVDVEGGEVAVLVGASGVLDMYSPRVLVENHVGINPNVLDHVAAIMLPLGYTQLKTCRGVGVNDYWTLWSKE